jgi:hypothetical protein
LAILTSFLGSFFLESEVAAKILSATKTEVLWSME